MTWRVPKLWGGGECWILGGGPSLPGQFGVPEEVIQKVFDKELPLNTYSPYMSAIHEKHVIGVNMAFKIGDWIDMVFWGDKKWYLNNRVELGEFKGLKVTCHPHFANGNFQKENVKSVVKDNAHPVGISSDPSKASWNSNSGAAAISVAANMGATKIVLVGFDMKLGADKKQHWHSEYGIIQPREPKHLPFHRHLAGFPHIARDARHRGITIINACPDSEIVDFPKMSVADVLNGVDIPAVVVPTPRQNVSPRPPQRQGRLHRR